MNKTHKKALGFVGLGLVAAFTATAAALPAPTATAVSSVTDVIQVYVPHQGPEITVTTDSGEEGTSPNYSFKIVYENLKNLKINLVNRDEGGGLIVSEEILNEDLNWELGEKQINLNLNDYGLYGDFTFTITGLGEGNVPVERILTYKYTEVPDEKDPGEGEDPDADIKVPDEKVATTIVKVYDEDGNLVKEIEIKDPKDVENIDLSDLPDGNYTLEIIGKDKDGNIITTEKKEVIVDKDGTGSKVDVEIKDQGEDIGKVVITIKDKDGNVVAQIEVPNPNPGEKIEVPLPDNLPAGDYTITIDYYDTDGNKIDTANENFSKSDTSGRVPVEITNEVDSVKEVEVTIYDDKGNIVRVLRGDRDTKIVNVYDKDGKLLFSVPNGLSDQKITIPMEGLDSGEYTAVLIYKNGYGKQVGNSVKFKIKYDAGKAIIVPDTGSFFQNLNISREDYLITGLVVFVIIGVVAFGIVIRNKRNRR